jgi:hypothetical protein
MAVGMSRYDLTDFEWRHGGQQKQLHHCNFSKKSAAVQDQGRPVRRYSVKQTHQPASR